MGKRKKWIDRVMKTINMNLDRIREIVGDKSTWHGPQDYKESDMTEQQQKEGM